MLYEPSSPPLFYALAHRRVNNKRHAGNVDEDVLQIGRLSEVAAEFGGKASVRLFDDFVNRSGPIETFYYLLLRKVPLLKRFLPCTVNVEITKEIYQS